MKKIHLLKNTLKRILKRIFDVINTNNGSITYAQCGEDKIIQFAFYLLEIKNPTYLDIGANHPTDLSNTYLFYKEGSTGVCIEPDPNLIRKFVSIRPNDICLNIGITAQNTGDLTFYVFDCPTLNTFSVESRNDTIKAGFSQVNEIQVPVSSVNTVIAEHFKNSHPNLVSLDTEGLDMQILETFDFVKYRPEVFCIETLTSTNSKKIPEISEFMISKGYFVYADTFINTIYIESNSYDSWLARTRIM